MAFNNSKSGFWFSFWGFVLGAIAIIITYSIQLNVKNEIELEQNCKSSIKYFDIVSHRYSHQECYSFISESFKNAFYYDKFFETKIRANLNPKEIELASLYRELLFNLLKISVSCEESDYEKNIKTHIDSLSVFFNNLELNDLESNYQIKIRNEKDYIEQENNIIKKLATDLDICNTKNLGRKSRIQITNSSLLFNEAALNYLNNEILLDDYENELRKYSLIFFKRYDKLLNHLLEKKELSKFYQHNNELNYLFVNMASNETKRSSITDDPIDNFVYETTNRIFFKLNKKENFTFHKSHKLVNDFYVPEYISDGISNSPNKKNVILFFDSKKKLVFDYEKRYTLKNDSIIYQKIDDLQFHLFYLNMVKLINSDNDVFGDLLGFLEANYHNTIYSLTDILFDQKNLKRNSSKKTKLFYKCLTDRLPDIYLSYSKLMNDIAYSEFDDPDLYVKPDSCFEDISQMSSVLSQNIFSDILQIKLFSNLNPQTICNPMLKNKIQINKQIQKRRDAIYTIQGKFQTTYNTLKYGRDSLLTYLFDTINFSTDCYCFPINDQVENILKDNFKYHYIEHPEVYDIKNRMGFNNRDNPQFNKNTPDYIYRDEYQIPLTNIVAENNNHHRNDYQRVLIPQKLIVDFLKDTKNAYDNKEFTISSECSIVDISNEDIPKIYFVEFKK